MCGRFVGFRNIEELKDYFPIDIAECEATANYNVVPSQEILAIIQRDNKNRLQKLHWGLVPFWAKDVSIGNRMINARVETVATKPSFRSAFLHRRCLILADGFYEWTGPKGQKQPVFLSLPDKKPFAFAGLWEKWNDKGKAVEDHYSCTIITTNASKAIRHIHHRMPVIINPPAYGRWLDPDFQDGGELLTILRDETITELVNHPVSRQVNSVRYNEPSNIQPLKQMDINF